MGTQRHGQRKGNGDPSGQEQQVPSKNARTSDQESTWKQKLLGKGVINDYCYFTVYLLLEPGISRFFAGCCLPASSCDCSALLQPAYPETNAGFCGPRAFVLTVLYHRLKTHQ